MTEVTPVMVALAAQLVVWAAGYGALWATVRHVLRSLQQLEATVVSECLHSHGARLSEHHTRLSILERDCHKHHG